MWAKAREAARVPLWGNNKRETGFLTEGIRAPPLAQSLEYPGGGAEVLPMFRGDTCWLPLRSDSREGRVGAAGGGWGGGREVRTPSGSQRGRRTLPQQSQKGIATCREGVGWRPAGIQAKGLRVFLAIQRRSEVCIGTERRPVAEEHNGLQRRRLRIPPGLKKGTWGPHWGSDGVAVVHTAAQEMRTESARGPEDSWDPEGTLCPLGITGLPLPRAPRARPAGTAPASAPGGVPPAGFPPPAPGQDPARPTAWAPRRPQLRDPWNCGLRTAAGPAAHQRFSSCGLAPSRPPPLSRLFRARPVNNTSTCRPACCHRDPGYFKGQEAGEGLGPGLDPARA